MHQDHEEVYLPNEILYLFAQCVHNFYLDPPTAESSRIRQQTLYNFCLISRRWYSVGIEFLYWQPRFFKGNSFTKFANTLCPPKDARKSRADFGSMVRVLSLVGLVHHSSNSLTARILGQTKKNLQILSAPSVSFGVNCLPAVSKSRNLITLDLSLVSGTSISFSSLKKAVSNLPKLQLLLLPFSMSLTHTDPACQWPPQLQTLQICGNIDPQVMTVFDWPPAIKELHILKCPNLHTAVLESVLQNEQLRVRLEHLDLSDSNGELCTEQVSNVLYTLPNLVYLQIPLDITRDLLILPAPDGLPALPIRALELEKKYHEDPLGFDLGDELLVALKRNLSNLWALGFCTDCLRVVKPSKRKKIEDALWTHVDEGDEWFLDKLDDLGLYSLGY